MIKYSIKIRIHDPGKFKHFANFRIVLASACAHVRWYRGGGVATTFMTATNLREPRTWERFTNHCNWNYVFNKSGTTFEMMFFKINPGQLLNYIRDSFWKCIRDNFQNHCDWNYVFQINPGHFLKLNLGQFLNTNPGQMFQNKSYRSPKHAKTIIIFYETVQQKKWHALNRLHGLHFSDPATCKHHRALTEFKKK